MVGRTVHHYQFLEKLGAGGMGEIWKAQDTRLNRSVAVKVLTSASAGDPERRVPVQIRAARADQQIEILEPDQAIETVFVRVHGQVYELVGQPDGRTVWNVNSTAPRRCYRSDR
jgi:serine/threonine protein kinase